MAPRSLVREGAEGDHRLRAVRAEIEGVAPEDLTEGALDAIAMTVADVAKNADSEGETLRLLADELDRLIAELGVPDEPDITQAEERGRLVGYRQVVHWLLQRAVSDTVVDDLNPDTHAYALLRLVDERPGMSNSELVEWLGVSESEVSRVGRRVFGRGLASKRRIGNVNHWEITPRGKRALQVADSRFGFAVEDEAPELESVSRDIGAILVGALLEADVEQVARSELEADVATTAIEMLKQSGVGVDAKPDLAVRFLDGLHARLYDIGSVVTGSKLLAVGDLATAFSELETTSAKAHKGLLGEFKFAPEESFSSDDGTDLRLAKASDGTWHYSLESTAAGAAEGSVKGARARRVRSGAQSKRTRKT